MNKPTLAIVISSIGAGEITTDSINNISDTTELILKLSITIIGVIVSPFIEPLVTHLREYLKSKRKHYLRSNTNKNADTNNSSGTE